MDKFAIDLDKVLDDFEESEDRAIQLDQKTTIKDDSLLKNNLDHHVQNVDLDNKLFYISNNLNKSHHLCSEHLEKLDLSEADFAATLKPSTLLSVPVQCHVKLPQVDVQTKSFQNTNENASTDMKNDNFFDANKRTRDFKNYSSESDNCINEDTSNKHFTNGYHVQAEEVLCISLQNTSENNNDSFKSSDIKIQLLPSFPVEHFKEKNDCNKIEIIQNTNIQNSESNIIACSVDNDSQNDCESLVTYSNVNNSELDKLKIDSENCDEIQTAENITLNNDKNVNVSNIEQQSQKDLENVEMCENEDNRHGELSDNIINVDKQHSSSEDCCDDDVPNCSDLICNNENVSKNQNNITIEETNSKDDIKIDNPENIPIIGFSNIEINDTDVNEIDEYLHDILNDSLTIEENDVKHKITELSENEQFIDKQIELTTNSIENNNNDQNVKLEKVQNQNLLNEYEMSSNVNSNKLQNEKPEDKDLYISSHCKILTEEKDEKINNKEKQEEKKSKYDVEDMGARPKFIDYNLTVNEFNDKIESALSVNSSFVDTCEHTVLSCNQDDFLEKSIPLMQVESTDSNINETEIFIHSKMESCQAYDDNGNLTDQIQEISSASSDNTVLLNEKAVLTQPGRLPRPTTLNLPVRVSVRPQIPTEFDNCSNETISENIENDNNELKRPVIDSIREESQVPLNLSEEDQQLGKIKPFWIPDGEASNCMHCDVKFTVIKRRHHCRACGKVLCSQCCSQKSRLPHLDNKEARVCQHCIAVLIRVQEWERLSNNNLPPSPSSGGSSPSLTPSVQSGTNSPGLISNQQDGLGWWPPNPNNPQEYCSTISPLQQAQPYLNCPPPTVMVPIGVLKRGDKPKGEPKQVMFSDGIRPGGDLTDQSEISDHPLPYRRQGRVQRRIEKSAIDNCQNLNKTSSEKKPKGSQLKVRNKRIVICDSEGPLPPILLPPELISEGKPDIEKLINWLTDEQSQPIIFALTKNLHISAKIVTLDCCVGKECWCFSSNGLNSVGQDEVIVILERFQNENSLPRDVFRLFSSLYDNASKGRTVGVLGHLLFPEGLLGSRDHSGFLFVQHTFQCLGKLILPSPPFLIALLIQKWEVPWAKIFPLRLMLRLGAEFRYYPCPLISIRYRKPVYCEIGHTIMNVLADFRNYQFTIPLIPGVYIHMEEKKTSVNFPCNTYEKVMKVLSNSNDHVLAVASNFSSEADSHLVCMQNEDGNYQTQAINIQNTPRKVTGSSFIVFSGALKASTGLTAKSSIVEDGLLVQIPPDTMSDLKNALRDMKDFTIGCGQSNSQQPEEVILLQWTKDDKKYNIGVKSPIDDRCLEGIQSIRIHTGTDYAGDYHIIRWTEVFFLQMEESGSRQQMEPADPSRLAEAVAQACCQALTPHLQWLAEAELTKIGLRVTLDSDKVGYDIGAGGEPLPSMYMNALDSALIPVITCASTSNHDCPIVLELIFHVLLK